MRLLLVIPVFLISCRASVKQDIVEVDTDTVSQGSTLLYDSVASMLPKAEKAIKVVEFQIKKHIIESDKMVDSLKKENETLKETIRITKSIIIHDTIYIKEKTNFWGKKKISVDSSSTVIEDSTIIENK